MAIDSEDLAGQVRRPLFENFSFVDGCLKQWEASKHLKKCALSRKLLVADVNEQGHVPPSLSNLRANSEVVRAYTMVMAETGVIVTNRIKYVRAPIEAFYASFQIDTKTEHCAAITYGTAYIVKKMLHVVKRKWSRWEIPRAAKLHVHIETFVATYSEI